MRIKLHFTGGRLRCGCGQSPGLRLGIGCGHGCLRHFRQRRAGRGSGVGCDRLSRLSAIRNWLRGRATLLHSRNRSTRGTRCPTPHGTQHEVRRRVFANFLVPNDALGAQIGSHPFGEFLRTLLQRGKRCARCDLACYRLARHLCHERVKRSRHQLASEVIAHGRDQPLQDASSIFGTRGHNLACLLGRRARIDHARIERAVLHQVSIGLLRNKVACISNALPRGHGAADRGTSPRIARSQRGRNHGQHAAEHVRALHDKAAYRWILPEVDLAFQQIAGDLRVGDGVFCCLACGVVDYLLLFFAPFGCSSRTRNFHSPGQALRVQLAPILLFLRHRSVDGLVRINTRNVCTWRHDRHWIAVGCVAHESTRTGLQAFRNRGNATDRRPNTPLHEIENTFGCTARKARRLRLLFCRCWRISKRRGLPPLFVLCRAFKRGLLPPVLICHESLL